MNLQSLTPSPSVDRAFSGLVKSALNPSMTHNLNPDQISQLQRRCAEAEFQLELYWSQKIINSENPQTTLEQFPYYENYQKLTKLEYHSIQGCQLHTNHQPWLFIGGGPLPLTAIVLAQQFNTPSTVLDIDPTAIHFSHQLITQLGLQHLITIKQSSGQDYDEYYNHQTILVAALAGLDPITKEAIFQKIKRQASPSTHIMARSSYGNRQLLYRPIEDELFKHFAPVIDIHPRNEIVNSVIIVQNG